MGNIGGQALEIILFAILLCCMMIGANRGLFLGIFCVVRGMLVLAATLGIAPVISDALPESIAMGRAGIGYVIALMVSVVVIHLLSRVIKLAEEIPAVGGLNRFGGILLGAINGLLIIWCLLAILGAFQTYPWCTDIVAAARSNARVMWFQSSNPLQYILAVFEFPIL